MFLWSGFPITDCLASPACGRGPKPLRGVAIESVENTEPVDPRRCFDAEGELIRVNAEMCPARDTGDEGTVRRDGFMDVEWKLGFG